MTKSMKLIFLVSLITFAAGFAFADFEYEVNFGNRTTDHLGAFLTGSTDDPAVGFFVELLYAGPNDAVDLPPLDGGGSGNYVFEPKSMNPTGAYGDDIRVSWSHYGMNASFLGNDGNFLSDDVISEDGVREFDGGYYYLRAWEAPSPDYAMGEGPWDPPVAPATFYFGVSELLVNPGGGGGDTPPGIPNDILTFGAFSTTLVGTVVPEPSTLAMIFMGTLGLLMVRRRIRK